MALRRIGLVGCVKQKAHSTQMAKDLYTSTLFSGRRSYVEASCNEWWILSALHGLVDPKEELAPYEFTLKTLGVRDRRDWTSQLLMEIEEWIHPLRGETFEVHAGSEYRNFGLIDGLTSIGCNVVVPTDGMPIGRQLKFYKEQKINRGR